MLGAGRVIRLVARRVTRRVAGIGRGSAVAADVEGAVVVAEELVAVRAGPQVGAAFDDGVAPGAVCFEPMVASAQGCDVARTGGSAGVVFDGVVAVGAVAGGPEATCRDGAPEADA